MPPKNEEMKCSWIKINLHKTILWMSFYLHKKVVVHRYTRDLRKTKDKKLKISFTRLLICLHNNVSMIFQWLLHIILYSLNQKSIRKTANHCCHLYGINKMGKTRIFVLTFHALDLSTSFFLTATFDRDRLCCLKKTLQYSLER